MALGANDLEAASLQHLLVQLFPFVAQRGDASTLVGLGNRFVLVQHRNFALGITAKHDVGTTTGHVGGNRHHARPPRLHHDLGLTGMLLGIEHLVRQLGLGQETRQQLGVLDRGGTDQHRLSTGVAVADVVDDRVEFFLGRAIDQIVLILADHRPVGGDHHRFEVVDLVEFVGFGISGAGHAGELAVHAEIVLESDRGERLVLGLDLHPLLGLDGLVQAVRPAPACHQATGEFVDDHHFTVLHHVLLVAVIQRVRAQRGIEMVHERNVGRLIEARALGQHAEARQNFLGVNVSVLGEQHLVGLEVHGVVARIGDVIPLTFLLLEHRGDLIHLHVELGVVFRLPRDDQRGPRFVDEDRVDFVDDRIIERALDPFAGRVDHVVAQIVKTELVVGAVGDIRGIGFLLRSMGHLREVHADAQTQEAVDPAHPVRVTTRQVVVDRDDMHALARQRVEVDRERRGQGLALTGAHLGDLAVVQHHAPDHLHVEVAHAVDTLSRLADNGKGFHQQVVERGPVGDPFAELVGLGFQRFVAELLDLRFECVDGTHGLGVLTDKPVIAATEDLFQKTRNHGVGKGSFRKARILSCGAEGASEAFRPTARSSTVGTQCLVRQQPSAQGPASFAPDTSNPGPPQDEHPTATLYRTG